LARLTCRANRIVYARQQQRATASETAPPLPTGAANRPPFWPRTSCARASTWNPARTDGHETLRQDFADRVVEITTKNSVLHLQKNQFAKTTKEFRRICTPSHQELAGLSLYSGTCQSQSGNLRVLIQMDD
jgi:hypothetical protein